jgi:hypothetical protein
LRAVASNTKEEVVAVVCESLIDGDALLHNEAAGHYCRPFEVETDGTDHQDAVFWTLP